MQPPARTPFRAFALAAVAAVVAVGAAGGPGCTRAARARFEETRPPELLVEVLPRSAEVAIDGRSVGQGSRALSVPRADADAHVLTVRARGYVEERVDLPPDGAAGSRIGMALRPEGLGGGPLDLDAPEGLAAAAGFLLAEDEPGDAADYAERAVALEPRLAFAWRILGDARARQGDRSAAAAAWLEYLRAAPDATDAARVARSIEEVRGSGTLPAGP